MKKTSLKSITVIIIILCVVVILANTKTILFFQNTFNVPGNTIYIGKSVINVSDKWLLTDMRTDSNDVNMLYGVVPCYFSKRCSILASPYYIFSDLLGVITISESDESFVDKLYKLSRSSQNEIGWYEGKLDGYDVYMSYGKNGGDVYKHVIYINLGVDVMITSDNESKLSSLQKIILNGLINSTRDLGDLGDLGGLRALEVRGRTELPR